MKVFFQKNKVCNLCVHRITHKIMHLTFDSSKIDFRRMGVKNTSLLAHKRKVKSVQNYREVEELHYSKSVNWNGRRRKEYLLKSCQLTLFVLQNSPFSELPSTTTQRWFSSPKWVDRKHWLTLGLLGNSLGGKHAWQHQASGKARQSKYDE